ncbi:MAG: DUF5721 family protein [Lachnospiraceae bacterium]|nr:DUF5721 family protein [Lachnospiraceae bacterium]
MVALEIKNVKEFMNQLLVNEAFDSFSLEEATIVTANTFKIDGRNVPAYFEGTDLSGNPLTLPGEFASWKELKPFCLTLIRGKRSPVSFRITLHAGDRYLTRLKNEHPGRAADDLRHVIVNIRYEAGSLRCITGASYSTFVTDKSLENTWDTDFISSMTSLGIRFELL